MCIFSKKDFKYYKKDLNKKFKQNKISKSILQG